MSDTIMTALRDLRDAGNILYIFASHVRDGMQNTGERKNLLEACERYGKAQREADAWLDRAAP